MRKCPRCGREFKFEMPYCPDCPQEGAAPASGPSPCAPGMPQGMYGTAPPTGGAALPGGASASAPVGGFLPSFFEALFAEMRKYPQPPRNGEAVTPKLAVTFTSSKSAPAIDLYAYEVPLWQSAHPQLRELCTRACGGNDKAAEALYYDVHTSLIAVAGLLQACRNVMLDAGNVMPPAVETICVEASVSYLRSQAGFDLRALGGHISRIVSAGSSMRYPNQMVLRGSKEALENPGRVLYQEAVQAQKSLGEPNIRSFQELVRLIMTGNFA